MIGMALIPSGKTHNVEQTEKVVPFIMGEVALVNMSAS